MSTNQSLLSLLRHPEPAVWTQGAELLAAFPLFIQDRIVRSLAAEGLIERAAYCRWGKIEGERRLRLLSAMCCREWLDAWQDEGWMPDGALVEAVAVLERVGLGDQAPASLDEVARGLDVQVGYCPEYDEVYDDYLSEAIEYFMGRHIELIGEVNWDRLTGEPTQHLRREDLTKSREAEPPEQLIVRTIVGVLGGLERVVWPGQPQPTADERTFFLPWIQGDEAQLAMWDVAMSSAGVRRLAA